MAVTSYILLAVGEIRHFWHTKQMILARPKDTPIFSTMCRRFFICWQDHAEMSLLAIIMIILAILQQVSGQKLILLSVVAAK
jgi:hypothetical protein